MEALLQAESRGGKPEEGQQSEADLSVDVEEAPPGNKLSESQRGKKRKRGAFVETPSIVVQHVLVSPHGTDSTPATLFKTFKLTNPSI